MILILPLASPYFYQLSLTSFGSFKKTKKTKPNLLLVTKTIMEVPCNCRPWIFRSSHQDCLGTCIPLGAHSQTTRESQVSLFLILFTSPLWTSGKTTKPSYTPTSPTCTSREKRKKAALALLSSWLWKAAFYSVRDPQCREIRSLWLNTE